MSDSPNPKKIDELLTAAVDLLVNATSIGLFPDVTAMPPVDVAPDDPATTIFATGDKLGYWIASAQGSVFDYGDAPADGSMAGQPLNGRIIAATGW